MVLCFTTVKPILFAKLSDFLTGDSRRSMKHQVCICDDGYKNQNSKKAMSMDIFLASFPLFFSFKSFKEKTRRKLRRGRNKETDLVVVIPIMSSKHKRSHLVDENEATSNALVLRSVAPQTSSARQEVVPHQQSVVSRSSNM